MKKTTIFAYASEIAGSVTAQPFTQRDKPFCGQSGIAPVARRQETTLDDDFPRCSTRQLISPIINNPYRRVRYRIPDRYRLVPVQVDAFANEELADEPAFRCAEAIDQRAIILKVFPKMCDVQRRSTISLQSD